MVIVNILLQCDASHIHIFVSLYKLVARSKIFMLYSFLQHLQWIFSQVKIFNYTGELYWRICSKLENEENTLNHTSNGDFDFGPLAS